MVSPMPDLCTGSRGGEEMKQDGSLMNVHFCLPRLILSVQTGPRAGGRVGLRPGVHTLPSVGKCLRCPCVSVWVHIMHKNTHTKMKSAFVTLVSNQSHQVLQSAVLLLDGQSTEVNRRSLLVESRSVRCVFVCFYVFILIRSETEFD